MKHNVQHYEIALPSFLVYNPPPPPHIFLHFTCIMEEMSVGGLYGELFDAIILLTFCCFAIPTSC